tara:strand:+ start:531 stop:983 length:453 start_codon:yes stop_codon:yes gene_type:complete
MRLLFILLFIPLVSFGQDDKKEINLNIVSEDVTANRVGAFNSARMREWQNMRARRLQNYTYKPSKQTVLKLYRANKVIGMPLNAGISDEHMKKWLPKIDLTKKVVIEKDLSRDEIIKRLKEFKDLYDSGILTKEEYDIKAESLKKTLLGN